AHTSIAAGYRSDIVGLGHRQASKKPDTGRISGKSRRQRTGAEGNSIASRRAEDILVIRVAGLRIAIVRPRHTGFAEDQEPIPIIADPRRRSGDILQLIVARPKESSESVSRGSSATLRVGAKLPTPCISPADVAFGPEHPGAILI